MNETEYVKVYKYVQAAAAVCFLVGAILFFWKDSNVAYYTGTALFVVVLFLGDALMYKERQ